LAQITPVEAINNAVLTFLAIELCGGLNGINGECGRFLCLAGDLSITDPTNQLSNGNGS
jgi:hypothetical protein